MECGDDAEMEEVIFAGKTVSFDCDVEDDVQNALVWKKNEDSISGWLLVGLPYLYNISVKIP